MKIVITSLPKETLDDFAKEHGLTMMVFERDQETIGKHLKKFFAYFSAIEIKKEGFLTSVSGDGDTPEEAIQNYCKKISKNHLIYKAHSNERKEIFSPTILPIWTTENETNQQI